jgi:hypothetical protein
LQTGTKGRYGPGLEALSPLVLHASSSVFTGDTSHRHTPIAKSVLPASGPTQAHTNILLLMVLVYLPTPLTPCPADACKM